MIGSFSVPNTWAMPDVTKAVVRFCTECAGGQWYVKGCPEKDCPLYQHRMGGGQPSPAIIARTCLVFCPTGANICTDADCPLRPFRYER